MLNRRDVADLDDEENAAPNPFTRPGFLVSAAVIAVILVLGVIVLVRANANNAGTPAPSTAVTVTDTPAATPDQTADPAASICGLTAPAADNGTVSAPVAAWLYEGTTAYPTSPEYGPGKTAGSGYRYCFQHSPAGALVMAANAFAQGSDPVVGNDWVMYALSDGQYRSQLLSQLGTSRGSPNTRVKVAGFRVLSYNARTALVDLGVRASSANQNIVASTTYELTWQDGDWKINAAVSQPLDVATVPDLSGYTPWGV